MKILGLLLCVFGMSSAFAAPYGSCYVENGTAHAMYCSDSSDSGSGTGWVSTYDRNGSLRERHMMIYVGVAVMGCDEVGTVSVDSDIAGCSFQIEN